eukprot:1460453-Amphidinium_carterae.2
MSHRRLPDSETALTTVAAASPPSKSKHRSHHMMRIAKRTLTKTHASPAAESDDIFVGIGVVVAVAA